MNLRHQRLNALLDLILENQSLHVDDIVKILGVSPATARRDLDLLAQQQLVIRTRGGASLHPRTADLPLRYKTGRRKEQKRRIAVAAAALVQPGDVVGLNGGTTTTEVAREVATAPTLVGTGEPGVVVVTNAVNIANELTVRPHVEVVVTGGVARARSYELTGRLAERSLVELRIDTLFLGVDALDVSAGATAHNDREAAVNAIFVERSRRVVAVADSSKLGRTALARICDIEQIETLITDDEISVEHLSSLEAAGVSVLQA